MGLNMEKTLECDMPSMDIGKEKGKAMGYFGGYHQGTHERYTKHWASYPRHRPAVAPSIWCNSIIPIVLKNNSDKQHPNNI